MVPSSIMAGGPQTRHSNEWRRRRQDGLWIINLDEDPTEGGGLGSRLDGVAWRPEA